MKKYVMLLLACVYFSGLKAQVIQLYDPIANRTFDTERYSGIRGTPFLVDKWQKGSVLTVKGIYQNLELKFDAYENKLYFNKNDESFEFQDPIISFTFIPNPSDTSLNMKYIKGLSGSGLTPNQFVKVLAEGKVSLYRSDIKAVSEMSEINAGMVKTFANVTRYYVVKDKVTQLIKINKSEIMNLVKDQEAKIQAYISEHKISIKSESDAAEILFYYNQL
jgi:hypothetical protein